MPTSQQTAYEPWDPTVTYVIGHQRPDTDAIGSALGLARLLRRLGKGAVVWNRDVTPTVYRPLPGSDRIHNGEEPPAGGGAAPSRSAEAPDAFAEAA